MAAKAIAFTEANQPEFSGYAARVVQNSQALAAALQKEGMKIMTGGTDNHLLLVDALSSVGLTGRQGASALKECQITLNKNGIAFDTLSPMITSGLRMGTPALTSLGMGTEQMVEVANIIATVLKATKPGVVAKGANAGQPSKIEYVLDASVRDAARARVQKLLGQFVLYPELDLVFLQKHFA